MKNTPLLLRALILLCAASPVVACSSDKAVNIGNTTAMGSQLSDYAGTWDGYAQAYAFTPDGSDRVRLNIAADGQGTLEVGDQPPLAPATDPNVGYPPGADKSTALPALWEGISYPIYSAQVQADRVQIGIKPNDFYSSWCALQAPFAYIIQTPPDGGPLTVAVDGGTSVAGASAVMFMACPFDGGGGSTTGGVMTCYGELNGIATQIDCGKSYLCQLGVCACTAAGCGSSPLVAAGSPPSQYPVELDAALDTTGQSLTGTLALSANLRIAVVLQKQ